MPKRLSRQYCSVALEAHSRLEGYQLKQAAKALEELTRNLTKEMQKTKGHPKSAQAAIRKAGISPKHALPILTRMCGTDPGLAASFWFMLGWSQGRKSK